MLIMFIRVFGTDYFKVTNNTIKFEAAIDMDKFDITNVDNLSINTLLNMNKK